MGRRNLCGVTIKLSENTLNTLDAPQTNAIHIVVFYLGLQSGFLYSRALKKQSLIIQATTMPIRFFPR